MRLRGDFIFKRFLTRGFNMTDKYFQETIARNNAIFEQLGIDNNNNGVWIFGYGSLLWKVNFKYTEKRVGYIYGYARRLWQESRDHRGTPEKPGRVATLVPADDKQKVWGLLYYIPPEYLQDAMDILNFREKDGYMLKTVKSYERETLVVRDVILYVAIVKNNESLQETAQIAATTSGPSGANCEYLFNMADALRKYQIETDDDKRHTLLLDKLVKEFRENNKLIM